MPNTPEAGIRKLSAKFNRSGFYIPEHWTLIERTQERARSRTGRTARRRHSRHKHHHRSWRGRRRQGRKRRRTWWWWWTTIL